MNSIETTAVSLITEQPILVATAAITLGTYLAMEYFDTARIAMEKGYDSSCTIDIGKFGRATWSWTKHDN